MDFTGQESPPGEFPCGIDSRRTRESILVVLFGRSPLTINSDRESNQIQAPPNESCFIPYIVSLRIF